MHIIVSRLPSAFFLLRTILLWRHHCAIALPPLQKLRPRNRVTIPVGRVGEIDRVAISANHDEDMPTGVTIRGKTDDDGLPLIGRCDDLIERPGISPGRLEAKLLGGSCDAMGFQHSERWRNLAYLGFYFQNIGDAKMVTIGVEDLRHGDR